MRILIVNKYLYPKGGAETYIIKLAKALECAGNEAVCFGMADERNVLTNPSGIYAENMDFHSSSLRKLTYPFKIIYSRAAAKKIGAVMDDFKPDIVHLNNFNFQLTPSIIYAAKRRGIPVVYTAHDAQLVCPNHKLKNDYVSGLCRECDGSRYTSCIQYRCIHSSALRSVIGAAEGYIYRKKHTYRLIDKIICPSEFMERELLRNPDLDGRTVAIHNFIDDMKPSGVECGDYVLYFGRYSEEKGIRTLLEAAKRLPHIKFIFAGEGDIEITEAANVKNVGFKSGEELNNLIEIALFTVLPSEWAENCPFSVMESQTLKTPVLGADIGGIPELIDEGRTGLLFKSGSADDLTEKIAYLYENRDLLDKMRKSCGEITYDTISAYTEKITALYGELIK